MPWGSSPPKTRDATISSDAGSSSSQPPPVPVDFPSREGRAVAVRVTPVAERAIRSGHPWIFENSIREMSRQAPAGSTAVIFDRKDRFMAVGLLDPESPIRVRILQEGSPAELGEALFRERIRQSLELRSPLVRRSDTTGYRMVSGEGDRFPGLVIDRYGAGVVVKSYTPAWLPWLPDLLPVLRELEGVESIVHLPSRRLLNDPAVPEALREPVQLLGPAPEDGFPFLEEGLHFRAHPRVGHKTGFYLDQRENRSRVRRLAKDARVLNAFSYTGGFSVAAAAGGAREVTSLDLSGPALHEAERHFTLNRASAPRARHRIIEGDAFEKLEALGQAGERFDLVIVDPPSFARERGQEDDALGAYAALTRLALPLLDPGGILVQASCTARIEADTFFHIVLDTARRMHSPLDEIERTGHPLDHPIRHPEGAYLKCLFARKRG
jgi:23S rRNA (cytosine1962-C5)-methyltransferase